MHPRASVPFRHWVSGPIHRKRCLCSGTDMFTRFTMYYTTVESNCQAFFTALYKLIFKGTRNTLEKHLRSATARAQQKISRFLCVCLERVFLVPSKLQKLVNRPSHALQKLAPQRAFVPHLRVYQFRILQIF